MEGHFLKDWRKKEILLTHNSISSRKYLLHVRQNKDIFQLKEKGFVANSSVLQETLKSFSSWKELTPDENLDLQEGTKGTGNNKCVDTYKRQRLYRGAYNLRRHTC